MEKLSVLMILFERLNIHHSKEFINHFDLESGNIELSNEININVNDISDIGKMDSFLAQVMDKT